MSVVYTDLRVIFRSATRAVLGPRHRGAGEGCLRTQGERLRTQQDLGEYAPAVEEQVRGAVRQRTLHPPSNEAVSFSRTHRTSLASASCRVEPIPSLTTLTSTKPNQPPPPTPTNH